MSDTVKVMPASSYKAKLNGNNSVIRAQAVETAIELIHAQALAGRSNLDFDLENLGKYADSIEAALNKKSSA